MEETQNYYREYFINSMLEATNKIERIKNFPINGITFLNWFPIMKDPDVYSLILRTLADLLKKDLSKVLLQFTVHDTGIGLSKEQSAKLFKPFNQSDSSNSRKYGGTGLGLSISKNLVEMMNGKIWVESELDKGSMFKFTIELLESNESQSDIQIPIELSSTSLDITI